MNTLISLHDDEESFLINARMDGMRFYGAGAVWPEDAAESLATRQRAHISTGRYGAYSYRDSHIEPQELIHKRISLPSEMGSGCNGQASTEGNMIIIYATSDSSDGLVKAGRTYADPLSGPLVLLSALETGALEYWNSRGMPYRRAAWSGVDVRATVAVRGLVSHHASTGRADDNTIVY